MGKSQGYIKTVQNVLNTEGGMSLYRGALSAATGSVVFRATGFAVFELFFTRWEKDPTMTKTIPFTGGIELRTVVAGVASGSFRAILECPFEYAKVRRQTGQNWVFSEVYKGFPSVYPRGVGIMGGYFIQIDSWRRHTNIMSTKLGQFACSGMSAMFCYWVIWPFEVLKNLAQVGTVGVGSTTL